MKIVDLDSLNPQDSRRNQKEETETPYQPEKKRKVLTGRELFYGLGVMAVLGIMAASFLGFIPWIPVEAALQRGSGFWQERVYILDHRKGKEKKRRNSLLENRNKEKTGQERRIPRTYRNGMGGRT